jgi:hypothetical protein
MHLDVDIREHGIESGSIPISHGIEMRCNSILLFGCR